MDERPGMTPTRIARAGILLVMAGGLAACSGGSGLGGWFSRGGGGTTAAAAQEMPRERVAVRQGARESVIWDLFDNADDPNTTVEVNRYLWQAALEVLDFLPVESVDPFSGVFVTGFGTPPGGRTPYRATVHVTDPALDARSLNVAVATRTGPASAQVQRAIEDAILTRARQLRARDMGL
jgi:hypothetical protein